MANPDNKSICLVGTKQIGQSWLKEEKREYVSIKPSQFFLRACNNGQWLIIVAGAADISGVSRVSQIFLWVLAKMEVTVQTILAAYIGCTEYKFIKYTLSLHNPTKLMSVGQQMQMVIILA